MMEVFLGSLPWILPPALGAVIGYVTNALAIRMLFRPLTVKHLFRIPIPFTPGIIPKQRGTLADSIARMVSKELLTEDTLKRQIRSEKFEQGIHGSIQAFTEKILAAQLGSPSNLLAPDTDKPGKSIIDGKDLVISFLSEFFKSETFRNMLEMIVVKVIKLLLEVNVKEVLLKLDSRLFRKLVEILTSERMEERVMVQVENIIRKHAGSRKSLKQFLPDELFRLVKDILGSLYPSMVEALLSWMRSESVREQLEIRGRILLRDVMEKLTAIQRFFISAGQYDKVLDEKMPEIVADIIRAVEQEGAKPETREKLIEALVSGLTGFRGKTFQDMELFKNEDELVQASKNLVSRLFTFLAEEHVKGAVTDWVQLSIQDMPDVILGNLIEDITGAGEEKVISSIAEIAVRWFHQRGKEVGSKLYAFLSGVFDTLESKPLGEFLGVQTGMKQSIDLFVSEKVIIILEEKIPDILDSFDVEQLVKDRINGLDMENVEKLLLMVIERHLKWINIFGAILGALIGTMQVVINRVV